MAQRHPNQDKMQAAVARWISEAQGRSNGAELLRQRADWVEQQLRVLSAWAAGRADLPAHLLGLTAPDLIGAQSDLISAAAQHRRAA